MSLQGGIFKSYALFFSAVCSSFKNPLASHSLPSLTVGFSFYTSALHIIVIIFIPTREQGFGRVVRFLFFPPESECGNNDGNGLQLRRAVNDIMIVAQLTRV